MGNTSPNIHVLRNEGYIYIFDSYHFVSYIFGIWCVYGLLYLGHLPHAAGLELDSRSNILLAMRYQ